MREDLDETERSLFNPPQVQAQNMHETTRIVRSWLGLKDVNNFDSYRAALEAKGILVFRSNGYNGKW